MYNMCTFWVGTRKKNQDNTPATYESPNTFSLNKTYEEMDTPRNLNFIDKNDREFLT